ncbi:MAG: flagellar biosynthesis protein FlhF [Deltaproteobacteria bacterium]|nr:flagellar biosynthesis protein FlhF [Deltaproteobacteria bacterium]
MQLKRYEGKTLRGTLERVKQELGPDALIVSSRTFRKEHGLLGLLSGRKVEVVAAIDRHTARPNTLKEAIRHTRSAARKTSPAPESGSVPPVVNKTHSRNDPIESLLEELDIGPEMSAYYRQMVRSGVQPQIAFRLIRSAQETLRSGESPAAGLTEAVEKQVPFVNHEKETPKFVALIGPTGVGKTTTVAKLAARDRFEKQKSVAFVTMDTYRIAAVEQLRVYANILGVPLHVAHKRDELSAILQSLERFDRVYVDTAGRSPWEECHIRDLGYAFERCIDLHPMLLVGANTNEVDARYIVKRYSELRPRSLVITKADECMCFGPVLNYLTGSGIPLAYVSNGQNVPDDLEAATPKSILRYLFMTRKSV